MIRKVIVEIYKSGILLTLTGVFMILDSNWVWRYLGLGVLGVGLFTTDKYISESSVDTSGSRIKEETQ